MYNNFENKLNLSVISCKLKSIRRDYKMKNNIIIAGVPGAGKSTISHQLAKQYGYQYISMDSIIPFTNQMKNFERGRSIL